MSEPRKPSPAAPKPTPAKPAAAKPSPAKPESAALVATEAATPEHTSKLSWILGWIVAPASVVGAIFGGGVLLGAHRPDGWFARSVMWVTGLF